MVIYKINEKVVIDIVNNLNKVDNIRVVLGNT